MLRFSQSLSCHFAVWYRSPIKRLIIVIFFFLMIRRPPRSTLDRSSAASDVYKRQHPDFAILAARIAVSNLHKSTSKLFSRTISILYNYIDPKTCLLYTSPSPRDRTRSRMPPSAWKKKIIENKYIYKLTTENNTKTTHFIISITYPTTDH